MGLFAFVLACASLYGSERDMGKYNEEPLCFGCR